MNRLNAWERLGVVLTLLWIVVGGIVELSRRSATASNEAGSIYRLCVDAHPESPTCSTELASNLAIFREGIWGDTAIAAFAPPFLAWGVVLAIISIARWVLAGRRTGTHRPPTAN